MECYNKITQQIREKKIILVVGSPTFCYLSGLPRIFSNDLSKLYQANEIVYFGQMRPCYVFVTLIRILLQKSIYMLIGLHNRAESSDITGSLTEV